MMSASPSDFGASFKKFMDHMAAAAPRPEPPFHKRFTEHLQTDPITLPVVAESFASHDHPNLQRALDAITSAPNCRCEIIGVVFPQKAYAGAHLSDLMSGGWHGISAVEGPVEYTNVPLDGEQVLTCVKSGILLITRSRDRIVCMVQEGGRTQMNTGVSVEVLAPRRETAERLLADIRTAMRSHNVYRGRIISLSHDWRTGLEVHFHALPQVARDSIILPEDTLRRIERQTIAFSRNAARLAAAGRHLKRGVLLHGPPGTGKTLTAMYLAGAMKDRTVLLVTGRGQGLIEQVCWMARALEPATVILEDADLIAESREDQTNKCVGPLLFELLNQMDGLAEDSDILFLLTTNRPEDLEPALAARPGRIDEAILVPLPDAECRRRLFALYGTGLDMRLSDPDRFIRRTEGASAAFIRELIRKAALFACDGTDSLIVQDRHIDEALRDLVLAGGALTKRLLGFTDPNSSAVAHEV